MSFCTTPFRPLTTSQWGPKSQFRGAMNCLDYGSKVFRQQIGTVVLRNLGRPTTTFITGVTRDSSSNPLANCVVMLFKTGSDAPIAQTVSDGGGNYSFAQPGSGPFFVVAYLAGSPDVAGTSVNTLVAV